MGGKKSDGVLAVAAGDGDEFIQIFLIFRILLRVYNAHVAPQKFVLCLLADLVLHGIASGGW